MAHSVRPGLVIALAVGIDPSIGVLISGLQGALMAERLNRHFKGREEGAINTVMVDLTSPGVSPVVHLLCAPVLIHVEHSRSLRELVLRSTATGLLLCGGGMMLSIAMDLPPGPLIEQCVLDYWHFKKEQPKKLSKEINKRVN